MRGTKKQMVQRFTLRWTALAVALLTWELVARTGEMMFLPPFTTVVTTTWDMWIHGGEGVSTPTPIFWNDFVPSVSRALIGWGLAAVAGIALGMALGVSARLSALFEPVVHFLRTIPPVALVPIFIIVVGLGTEMRLAMITFGCMWPIVLNTIQGVRTVDPQLLETSRAFGIGTVGRLWRVYIPAASPKIFAGLRIALSIALILMVVSEMVAGGGAGGIGEVIVRAQRSFMVVEMWTAIVVVGVLGYTFNRIFEVVENAVIGWSNQTDQERV
jgi:ABC-type nitrate/sulfonate/bicarbonate transport system permease component